MKAIQEVMRLKNALDSEITQKQTDPMFLDTVRDASGKLRQLRQKRETVGSILDNYIVWQWLLDTGITDSDVLNTEK